MSEPAAPLRDVAIVGGGCYGTFYARQLETARRKARLEVRRILVVDRDPACQAAQELAASPALRIVPAEWDAFLREFLDSSPPVSGTPDDAVVPSPLMPHLMATWLLGIAQTMWPDRDVHLAVPAEPLGTPYDALGHGVGMFGAAEIRASRELVEAAGNREVPIDVVIATVSACHGAMSILRFGAKKSSATPGYISRP